jgi:predicted membrane-bound mannosyltransferase
MDSALQAIQQFANGFYTGAQAVIKAAEPWQILLVVGALILMVLFLAIGLRVANRSGEGAMMALEDGQQQLKTAQDQAAKADEKAVKAEEKAQKADEKAVKAEEKLTQAQQEKKEALAKLEAESSKGLQLIENQNQLALAKARIEQLERLQSEETMFMTSARMEAARIVRDAKDYAFTVASRSDVEYAEMMRHASEEAENLRAQSQQRLDQAHDTLKKALHRATEIIAEAHAEAACSNRPWYEAPPARLMDAEPAAPSAEAAPEEPASAAQDT